MPSHRHPAGHSGDRFPAEAQQELKAHFGIGHSTLQIEIHRPEPQEHGPECPWITTTMPVRGTILGGTPTLREHRIFCRNAVSVMILVA